MRRFAATKGGPMFQVLNAYLFQHRSISIPGLGTIYLETFSASVDVADRIILPPLYQFRFDKYFDSPDREFFAYIASQQNVLDYEAIKWYNEFSLDLRNRIRQEDKVEWEGVGTLKKDEGGNIMFEPAPPNGLFLTPVPALRVNRENAQHTLLVGDQERTNVEMNEWLLDEEEASTKRKPWWIAALILAILALVALGWHFYNNGWSIGNQNSLIILR
ncbi:hypothetical protein Q4E93_16955 [Flavitalea sp. BT771]|uniref:hypothetical protein n=1 Tax=Flavitalea sp. BT771 TaxID=3063329 RepID=UPI0026E13DD6|nr:hypothetical protein [Flavitalea sp. BT771]MDO6432294.1 hypothetical protein [Flavitalea sp. BT771]MDV6221204.1 hypothetical protein [Flavitalea sp. BT771]